MDFKRITDKAKDLVEKRGGTDSVKEDADELRDIAKGSGSLSDKAKAAASALKEPGAPGVDAQRESSPAAEAGPVERDRPAEKGERGAKHGRGGGKRRREGAGGRRKRDGGDADPAV